MMTEGFGWLPPSVQGRIEAEERAEEREARRAEEAREVHREQLRDGALAAYRSAAEQRGEVVSAVALARGEVAGRSIEDVFRDAAAAADREDGRAAARQRHEDGDGAVLIGEPVIQGASRSAWPSTEYEADSLISRGQQLHRDLVAMRAKRDYPTAVEAARTKAARAMIEW